MIDIMPKTHSKRWSLGLVLLGVVVVCWVLSSVLISVIFEEDLYRKPFWITYLNTSSFIFYLIPTFRNVLERYNLTGQFSIREELVLEEEGDVDERSSLMSKNSSDPAIKLTLSSTIKLSAQFCVLWFLANLVTNASLSYTSVGSQTILSSTSSFFTLLVSALCHLESINKVKVCGSVLSFIGIVLVTRSDYAYSVSDIASFFANDVHNSIALNDTSAIVMFIGNVLALAGALLYGVYSTLLKLRVQDESRINMKIFFGFVGFFTLVFQWPIVILLHYTGTETFQLPNSPKVFWIVFINCVITFISDYCWAKAMLLTSPLIVTVGLSTTIPLAMVIDFFLKHKPLTVTYLFGASLICGSFFIINRNAEEEALAENNLETSQEVHISISA